MCYAIPGKLVEINGNIGVVDYFGELRNVLMDTDARVGDYVYAQGGVLISKIPAEEAQEILVFWKDRFFELKKVDAKLAEVNGNETGTVSILPILQKANTGKELDKNDILELLKTEDENEIKLLCDTANNARQKDHDNACCVHGILEFSNYCANDCHYCGIRKGRKVKRYRMNPQEIISNARYAIQELGFKAIVLQSGEDSWYDDEKLAMIVKEVREMGVLVFISIGVRSKETYKKLYAAGARAVLLRFETSDKKIFEELRPCTSFEERIELIKYAKELGYLVATGFIFGLPGETDSTIADNILLTKSLDADMHSFGPLIPSQDTPLFGTDKTNINTLLKIIAISRLTDRKSKILVTTAMETLDSSARKKGLLSGGNSLMLNLTPISYRQLYSIYPGRADKDKEIKPYIKETTDLLYSIGRAPTDIGL